MRALLLILVLALGACSEQPPAALAPEAAAERDSVLVLLRAADTGAFDAAYARLADIPYRVSVRTEQLGAGAEPLAVHTRTVHVTPDGAERVTSDSSGAFDHGAFERFAERSQTHPAVAANPAHLVLGEPAYLDPRGREVFTFTLAGDTLIGDQPLRILSVTARPGEGDEQALRSARLYLDADGTLVGARVRRMQESVLFGESSGLMLFLQPGTEGWLPHVLTVDSRISAPLTEPRRFRLSERYDVAVDG